MVLDQQDITIESLGKCAGEDMEKTVNEQPGGAYGDQEIMAARNQKKKTELDEAYKELDLNYKCYFIALAVEFGVVTVTVVGGIVLLGVLSGWSFE